jgi:hypothetical protein
LMYEHILKQMIRGLDQAKTELDTQDSNHLARLSELASIMSSFALQQLSVTLTNIYETSPEATTKLIAVLLASGMLYNYLPESLRLPFQSMPYFGELFNIINRANPELLLIQNSAATVTTIFYLLKNLGIDTTEAIASLGSMASAAAVYCTRQTGKFVCSVTSSSITGLQNGAIRVSDLLLEILGQLLTSEYNNTNLMIEDTQVTLSSQQQSALSMPSLQSVRELTDVPINEGGIDIAGAANPPDVVGMRFDAIVQGEPSNPVIATPIIVASNPIQVAETEQYFSDSLGSEGTSVSDITTNSRSGIPHWLFGSISRGGKKNRKSRRHIPQLRKSRKGRKGRKGRITKKGRKSYKTLKRYRGKMRR